MTPLVLLHPCVKHGNRYKDQDAVIELRTRNFPFQRENSGQYAVIIQLDIVQPVELSPIDIMRSDPAHNTFYSAVDIFTADESFAISVRRP